MDDPNRLLLTPEVAEITRRSEGTLRYWRHIGEGPASFRLGKRVVYRAAEVARWISEMETGDSAVHRRGRVA